METSMPQELGRHRRNDYRAPERWKQPHAAGNEKIGCVFVLRRIKNYITADDEEKLNTQIPVFSYFRQEIDSTYRCDLVIDEAAEEIMCRHHRQGCSKSPVIEQVNSFHLSSPSASSFHDRMLL